MADNAQGSGSFAQGFKDGLAVGLGYLSVSFTFGILAITSGLNWIQASIISLTNVTSAGQVAGVGIIAGAGGIAAMIIAQIVINLRYSLMGIALSQKTDATMTPLMRMLLAYGITDEIFGVAITRKHPIGARYFFGLTVLPVIGWTAGTVIGALLGGVFPAFLTNALSIGIYGMFVSIVIPQTKKDPVIMNSAILACVLSALMFYVPVLSSNITGGFSIIIAAVTAALCGVAVTGKQMSKRVSYAVAAVLFAALIAVLFFFAPGYSAASGTSVSSESGAAVSAGVFVPLFITMTVTTYLVRMIPFVLFRRKLTNPKVKAFFDYIPYTVLSAMTFPAILYSTGSVTAAVAGLAVALALSFMEKSLLVVAIGTCIGSLVVSVILMYI